MNNSEIYEIKKSLDVFIEGLRLLDYKKISEIFDKDLYGFRSCQSLDIC